VRVLTPSPDDHTRSPARDDERGESRIGHGPKTLACFAVAAPAGQAAAVYRLRTKVRSGRKATRPVSTFTLPRAVDF